MNFSEITYTSPMSPRDAEAQFEVYSSDEDNKIVVAIDNEGEGCGYIEVKSNGSYYVIAERSEFESENFNEAAKWLFDNWIKYL